MPVVEHGAIHEVLMRPGIRGKFLVSKDVGAHGLTLLLNTVEPGAEVPLHEHAAEESGYLLEGVIWVRIGVESHAITPQQTVVFPAGIPHAWGNPGPGVARILWVWNSPDPFGDSVYLEGIPPKH
jgi:quercetin dioxygenase-like cupin family protein